MATLTETSITSAFIGKIVNADNLKKCTWDSFLENKKYTVYSSGFLYDKFLMERFGATQKLKETWERRGTEFTVSVDVFEGKISAARIGKDNTGDGARPSGGGPLTCSQQDLRIARRILEFITE